MKASHFLSALLFASLAAPRLARADTPLEGLQDDAERNDWPACLLNVRWALRDHEYHLTGDSKLEPLKKAAGSLAVGATPTINGLLAECLAQAKADPEVKDVWLGKIDLYVGSYRSDIANVKNGDASFDTVKQQALRCYDVVDFAGQILDPTTALDFGAGNGLPDWKGSIADAKQICDQGQKAADEMEAKLLAPFVKAGMKSDKLQMIKDSEGSHEYYIPGGQTTLDPKKLVAASVWFEFYEGDSCARGTIHQMTRYQFDGSQKLAKTTHKDFCGDVPKSAYK